MIVIGNQSSGADISKDIATMAKEVHIAAKFDTYEKRSSCHSNIHIHPPVTKENNKNYILMYDPLIRFPPWYTSQIDCAHEDGSVVFQDGEVVYADAIVHCTGYKYRFPFLETNGYVTIEDNRVGPLYKHVFPPALAPPLSFISLPSMVSTKS